jgi:uncharacterized RDD family membrane protein YckC
MIELTLASWEKRFWAWLIDVLLIGIFSGMITESIAALCSVPFLMPAPGWPFPYGLAFFSTQGFLLFLYWTLTEGYGGQSVGKKVMDLRVTDLSGGPAGYGRSAVQSFGKVFFLVFDCLIGWIAMKKARQRVFNRISGTIVIQAEHKLPPDVRYHNDGD